MDSRKLAQIFFFLGYNPVSKLPFSAWASKSKCGENWPHHGAHTGRATEVPKGKFLEGIFCNPGGVRFIAMAPRDGSLGLVPSLPGWLAQ